eukprot:scaffold23655_cov65-Phaeocystis_antarctica.AAC.10
MLSRHRELTSCCHIPREADVPVPREAPRQVVLLIARSAMCLLCEPRTLPPRVAARTARTSRVRDKGGGFAVVVAGRGLAVDVEPPTLKTLLAGIKSVGLSEGARCWDLRESGGALCVQRVWQHSAPLVTFGRIAALSKRESLVASREQLGVLLARGQQPAAPRGIGRLIGTSIRRRLLVHVEGAELNTKRLCQPENELVRTANAHAAQFSAWKTALVRAGVGPSTTHSRREQATAYAIGSLNQHHVTWPERTGGSQPIPRISSGDAAAHNHNRLPSSACMGASPAFVGQAAVAAPHARPARRNAQHTMPHTSATAGQSSFRRRVEVKSGSLPRPSTSADGVSSVLPRPSISVDGASAVLPHPGIC